jgi:hypothetical protein
MIYWWIEFLLSVAVLGCAATLMLPVVPKDKKPRDEGYGSRHLLTWQLCIFLIILSACALIGWAVWIATEVRAPW